MYVNAASAPWSHSTGIAHQGANIALYGRTANRKYGEPLANLVEPVVCTYLVAPTRAR